MGMTTLNRHLAGSRARAAQIALGVLAVGGIALAVGARAMGNAEAPPKGDAVIPTFDLTPKNDAVKTANTALSGIADRLNQVANRPKPIPAAPVSPTPGTVVATAPPPPPPPPPLRFLGAVGVGAS